ncbi:amino acid permease [Algoriphagus lacus]|uniref:Arginine/agmatine antiporter n=1 Tax=Algoriphagus lacus TaxID=2056311 RepID=A0A418PQS1_9BACT|nr:amino acid permease [Algoriphagus lacus]RIW14622.1 amino acid permease [Algoriphagus lacus]
MNPPENTRSLGLVTVISLVAGGMIGSGIFTLPSVLAQFGGISLLGWLVAAIGAWILAYVMSALSKVIPETGGSYAYTKAAFGELPAFVVAWGFWLSMWSTNAAIALTFSGYFGVFFPEISQSPWFSVTVALLAIWGLTLLNSLSIRSSGNLQVVTTLLKVLPILVVAFGGILFIDLDNFIPFNTSQESSIQAITTSSVLCFYAFMGIESATIPAENIKQPEKTISKGTKIGVGLVIFLYLFSSFSLFGVLSPAEVAQSQAPFSDAANLIFGINTGYAVAAGACLASFGALNGWILLQGQIPYSMAKDGLLPRALAYKNPTGAPSVGVIVSSVMITILLLFNQSKGFSGLYEFMVLLTTTTSLAFYFGAVLAYGYFSFTRRLGFKRDWKAMVYSFLGLSFTAWIFFGAGWDSVILGVLALLFGIPVFWLSKRNGHRQAR